MGKEEDRKESEMRDIANIRMPILYMFFRLCISFFLSFVQSGGRGTHVEPSPFTKNSQLMVRVRVHLSSCLVLVLRADSAIGIIGITLYANGLA